MKQKINILINEEANSLGLYYGYWNWFIFKKLLNLGWKLIFLIGHSFMEDYLFLNSDLFQQLMND